MLMEMKLKCPSKTLIEPRVGHLDELRFLMEDIQDQLLTFEGEYHWLIPLLEAHINLHRAAVASTRPQTEKWELNADRLMIERAEKLLRRMKLSHDVACPTCTHRGPTGPAELTR